MRNGALAAKIRQAGIKIMFAMSRHATSTATPLPDEEADKSLTKPRYEAKGDIWICAADLRHHTRFFATGSFENGRKTPTPVEIFTFAGAFGVVPHDYLEQFPPESQYYDEIQQFKTRSATPSLNSPVEQ